MSTSGIGRWRERKGGQFASRQHLSSQRRAMLAPVQKWRKEWTSSAIAPTSSVKVLRWIKIEATDDGEEEAEMAAALDRAGGRDSAQLAGLSGLGGETDTPGSSMTPGPGTPQPVATPQFGKLRAPHPLSQSAVASPRAASPESMELDSIVDEQSRAHKSLQEVVDTREDVALDALARLPDGEAD